MLENVKNVPEYAYYLKAIVARWVDGDWWFWGAYDTSDAALIATIEIDGKVFWLD